MTIPSFAPHGALPPFTDGDPTNPRARSPYAAEMRVFVERFCTTPPRAKLLKGLNAYRKHLFKGGFVSGYHWLDGSFVENVEVTRKRPPSDIDVITLFNRPIKYQANMASWASDYPTQIHPQYFETRNMKPRFFCDTFAINLDAEARALVRDTTYWFGLFSDIRGSTEKKGIVEIPLATDPMEFDAIDAQIGGRFDV